MITIPLGYAPLISPYGSWISFGYERAGATHVTNANDQRLADNPGPEAIYPCGWFDDTLMAFERPVALPPPNQNIYVVQLWSFDLVSRESTLTAYPPDQWPGHNQIPVIDGLVLSWNPTTKQVFYETVNITPPGQTVESPQWDGRHYLYQDSQSVTSDGTAWKTYVRNVSDATILRVLDVPLLYAKPYDVASQCWVTGWVPGEGVRVWDPAGVEKRMAGEGVGPVTLDNGIRTMVWTCISGAGGEQLGVFGRYWDEFTKEATGIWVEGIWHSGLTVMPTVNGWLVAGYRQDTGEQRFVLVPFDTPRQPLPGTTPPVDPEEPEPPSTSVRQAFLLGVVAGAVATLVILALLRWLT